MASRSRSTCSATTAAGRSPATPSAPNPSVSGRSANDRDAATGGPRSERDRARSADPVAGRLRARAGSGRSRRRLGGRVALIAARLAAHWISGGLSGAEALHGGYFPPVVAGPFIASIGLSSVGLHALALYAFGAGLFFWLTLGTAVMYRHISGGEVPDSATPTLAAFLAAAATASIAWLVAHPGPGPLDDPQSLLTGVLFIMLFVQIALISRYRRMKFGMQYWVFTFPVASTSNPQRCPANGPRRNALPREHPAAEGPPQQGLVWTRNRRLPAGGQEGVVVVARNARIRWRASWPGSSSRSN
ncbi:hypothetical protein L1785_20540 [Antribacter sp. KLBMP9083]|uniref:Uncharacterized protein n=1 Tax=Antribacter soli TaxID=2910976 RepID=A0AA41UDR6_9MICO|nr:hypothetical protein [Antribacter soli]MCF4123359.1 hypothetical protein [Antribacter soli]